jgi:hypothetical protein
MRVIFKQERRISQEKGQEKQGVRARGNQELGARENRRGGQGKKCTPR